MANALAMVLAGGHGKRMDVLCHIRPKPALSFAGGFRVIDFSLSNCVHSGINEIVALTDYRRHDMADYLNRWKAVNAVNRDLAILEPQKGSYLGTADAVFQNLDYLRKTKADKVLILAGDHIYKMDYRQMIANHEKTGAEVTVGVVNVPVEEMFRFGAVCTDEQSRITAFVEKSRTPPSQTASMGIYIFDKSVLIERLTEDASRQDSSHDFGYSILPEAVQRNRVYAYQFDGYWQDIGNKNAYYSANMELIGQEPSFTLDSRWHILSEVPDLALMMPVTRGNIVNSLISPGCVIRGRVENSILSPGVTVEEQATVKNSILMSGASVGFHSVVDRSILDENVNVGRLCYIGFGNSLLAEPDITVLGKNVKVPDRTAVGRKCTILPHVRYEDFRGNIVPSGTTLAPVARQAIA